MLSGHRTHPEALVAQTAAVLAPPGLTLSREKTRITSIDEGIEFLGWRMQRHRASNGRRYVYASKPALRAVKAISAPAPRQQTRPPRSRQSRPGWRALAGAEHTRVAGTTRPEQRAAAADAL